GVTAHGVAPLGAVDRDARDVVGDLVEHLVGGAGDKATVQSVTHAASPSAISMTPASRRASMSDASMPSSASTEAVSAPTAGGALVCSRYSPSKVMGVLTIVNSPSCGCSISSS